MYIFSSSIDIEPMHAIQVQVPGYNATVSEIADSVHVAAALVMNHVHCRVVSVSNDELATNHRFVSIVGVVRHSMDRWVVVLMQRRRLMPPFVVRLCRAAHPRRVAMMGRRDPSRTCLL